MVGDKNITVEEKRPNIPRAAGRGRGEGRRDGGRGYGRMGRGTYNRDVGGPRTMVPGGGRGIDRERLGGRGTKY